MSEHHGGISVIAATILGICIIIAAVVIADPDYSDKAWSLATGTLHWLCWAAIIIVILIIIAFIILIIAEWK